MLHHKKPYNQLFVAFITMLLLTSCHTYYKTSQVQKNNPTSEATTIDSLRLSERYFILRSGSEFFYMKNPTLSADLKIMNCILDTVSFYHLVYVLNGKNGKMKYKKYDPLETPVLNEVHFQIPPDSAAVPGPYKLQLDQIQRIEVIEKDKQRTANSFVFGILGVVLGTVVVLSIIVIAATVASGGFHF